MSIKTSVQHPVKPLGFPEASIEAVTQFRQIRDSAPACLTALLFKMGAKVAYPARRREVHVASAFPLAHPYFSVMAWGL